ncbi:MULTISPECIES: type II CAAX endopeptidase family protein [Thiorhodovibrio]|uniref:type II CAAX endopeptidase family protein n=1 Tax=Thiorhodovibrio TaxID=61593 RepID=UPI00191472F7|nr:MULTISPECIES: type II CAAX endopeptidase family protein [Thiorhodovibrio]MBK5970949.1 hypothetical protein [Thiorhodovibrio winogradskyi]WPL10685.1 sensory histidine kinase AtoS [Thiorhodovibrio litoralis]
MHETQHTSDLLAQETIESMRDAVLSFDHGGTILMLNPAAERLFQISARDVIGQRFAQTFLDREELENLNDAILDAIYDPTTPHTAEVQIKRDSDGQGECGSILHLIVSTNLLVGEHQQPLGLVAVIADVSERVRLLQEKLEQERMRQLFGRLFVYTIGVMSIFTIANNLIARSIVNIDLYSPITAWGALVVLLIPSLIAIRMMDLTLQDLGISQVGLKRSLIEGAIASAILAALVAILAIVLKHYDLVDGKATPFEFVPALFYLLHSFFQEFITRGFMQSSFQRFLDDKKGFASVFLTSSLFGLFHLQFGLDAVLMTLVSGVIFGLFYLRTRNLAGVTMLHFFAGAYAFWFGLI